MIFALLWMRRIAGNRCVAGCGLQPRRPRRQLPADVFGKLFLQRITRQTGAKPSISMARTFGAGAGILRRERGLLDQRNSIWMDCDWMPRKTFTTNRRSYSGGDRPQRAKGRRKPRSIIIVAENEPQDTKLIRSQKRGRLRLDGTMERRFSPFRDGGADGEPRSVFRRLSWLTAGTAFLLEIWISLSRAMVFVAEAKKRHVHVGQQSGGNGDVSAESRPDRKFRDVAGESTDLLLRTV